MGKLGTSQVALPPLWCCRRESADIDTDSIYDWLKPDWPVPARVKAISTTRQGGVSSAPYASLNLGSHVGDEPGHVNSNRSILKQALDLPATPCWLNQVHSARVVDAHAAGDQPVDADAVFSRKSGAVCAVMTADCLPVLFASRSGDRVAAAHAGWRGLAAGVLEATIDALECAPSDLMAWMGPAIGLQAFEVGHEVRTAFVDQLPATEIAFVANSPGHWLADIYTLARLRLQNAGLDAVYGGGLCTWSDDKRFFSYRRDGTCGRMASLIWMDE